MMSDKLQNSGNKKKNIGEIKRGGGDKKQINNKNVKKCHQEENLV